MGLQPPEDPNIVREAILYENKTCLLTNCADITLPDIIVPLIDGGEYTDSSHQVSAFGISISTQVCCARCEDKASIVVRVRLSGAHLTTCRCAFINWKDRATAEIAAQAWANGLEIDGETVNVRWGRSKGVSGSKSAKAGPSSLVVSS